MTADTSRFSSGARQDLGRLMVAAQNGEHTAYNTLLRVCVPIIRAVARRAGAPVDCLDDIVQDTLMTVHRARHTYAPDRPFVSWVSVLAHRRTIDVLRRYGRNSAREINAPTAYENFPDTGPTPEQHADASLLRAELQSAIASLPPAQREAVQYLAINDQTLAEAAAATGRSTVSLKVNLHRALSALRSRLIGEEQ